MNKQQFMEKLQRPLKNLASEERDELLYDFEEHFEMGMLEGKSEEEITEQLGDPRKIGKDLLADYRITKAQKERSLKHMLQAVFAAVSLSFLNVLVVLGPALAVFGVFVGFCALALGLALAPLLFLGTLLIGDVPMISVNFFVSITLGSLGVLLGVGMYYIGRILYHYTLRYVQFNVRIVKGEEPV